MNILLITDTFPPLRSSGAEQLRDLAREFVSQGYAITVMTVMQDETSDWKLERIDGVRILRIKSPRTKDISYFRRTIAEFCMPFFMLNKFRKSPLSVETWDAVIWYSPSIFFGPVVKAIKKRNNCKSYLIIRDIFPQWALEVGLLSPGVSYKFFDYVARYQYSVADVIGVQSHGDLKYFKKWKRRPNVRLEVLPNWLGSSHSRRCSIRVNETVLAGRKVLVYAGNIGIAQGLSSIIELAKCLQYRKELGFLFVGRGSQKTKLQAICSACQLDNVLFQDEIHPDEISDLFKQCYAGVVSLATEHRSNNIPGKFIKYMQHGIPVLAKLNPGNDLATMIRDYKVGAVCESDSLGELIKATEDLVYRADNHIDDMPARCSELYSLEFKVQSTVEQIIGSLKLPIN
jgi:glycosyltransferase involved in cell wall biosynthesis